MNKELKQTELSSVPIIDFAPQINGTEEDRIRVSKEVDFACSNSGFFMVKGHGISNHIIDDAFDLTKRFFDMDYKDKMEVCTDENQAQGYTPKETLSLSKNEVREDENDRKDFIEENPDLKECYCICLGPESFQKSNQEGMNLKGFQPPKFHSNPHDLKDKYTAQQREVEHLSLIILESFTYSLNLPRNFFKEKNTKHMGALRTLNQPQVEDLSKINKNQLRCSAHSDQGAITLLKERLLTDKYVGYTGLQLEGKDKWQDARVPEECFTINLGDLMAFWTNNRWRSTVHRVNNPNEENNQRRLSMAQFANINSDVVIHSLDGDDSKHEEQGKITAGEQLMRKFYSAVDY